MGSAHATDFLIGSCLLWALQANVHAKLGANLVSALAYGVDISKGEKVLP